MNTKQVAQYVGNKMVARYFSITDAATLTSTQRAHIGKVCNGIRKTAGGSTWKYTRINGSKLPVGSVIQYDVTTGDAVAVFANLNTASEILGIPSAKIERVLSGASKKVNGYTFAVAI